MNVSEMMYANCRVRLLQKKDPNVADENFMFLASSLPSVWKGSWPDVDNSTKLTPNFSASIRVLDQYGRYYVEMNSSASLSFPHKHNGPTKELYLRSQVKVPVYMAGTWDIRPYRVCTIVIDGTQKAYIECEPTNTGSTAVAWKFTAGWFDASGEFRSVSTIMNSGIVADDNTKTNENTFYDIKLFIPKNRPASLVVARMLTGETATATQGSATGVAYGFNDSAATFTAILNSHKEGLGTNQKLSFVRFGLGNKITTARP